MKKNKSSLERKGRYLTMLLRHSPEKENLSLDTYGYCDVKSVCGALELTIDELNIIVETNNKKRFEFNDNKTKIKASQGHSIDIKFELEPITPPNILYHGTTYKNSENINKTGLNKMKRHHVHLTNDYDTAFNVGLRYAKEKDNVWVIKIDSKKMNDDGFVFYKTNNDVYLIDYVPQKYFL